MKINPKDWKQLSSDSEATVLQHKSGHQMRVIHKALSPDNRAIFESMAGARPPKQDDFKDKPNYAQGTGDVEDNQPPGDPEDISPEEAERNLRTDPNISSSPYRTQAAVTGEGLPNSQPRSPEQIAKIRAQTDAATSQPAADAAQPEPLTDDAAANPAQSAIAPAAQDPGQARIKAIYNQMLGPNVPASAFGPNGEPPKTLLPNILHDAIHIQGIEQQQKANSAEDQQQSINSYNQAAAAVGMPPKPMPAVPSAPRAPGTGAGYASAGPTTSAAAPATNPDNGPMGIVNQQRSGMATAYGREASAAIEQATGEQNVANAAQLANDYKAIQAKQVVDSVQKNINDTNELQQNVVQSIIDNPIHQVHLFDNQNVGQKVMSTIGLIMGGLGAGANGVNPALEYLNKQMEQDVAKQKANMETKVSLLGYFNHVYQNQNIAQEATKSALDTYVKAKVDEAANRNNANGANPMVQSRLLNTSAVLGQKIAQSNAKVGMMQLVSEMTGASKGVGSPNLAAKLDVLRQFSPDDEKSLRPRAVFNEGPNGEGVIAGRELSPVDQDKIANMKNFSQKATQFKSFIDQHAGSLDPATINTGKAMAQKLRDSYIASVGGGPETATKADAASKVIPEDPTAAFSFFRTTPFIDQTIHNNLMNLNSLRRQYQMPERDLNGYPISNRKTEMAPVKKPGIR